MMAEIKDRLITVIPLTVFFVFTVLFYGPLSLFLPNSEEFWFTLPDLLKVIVPFSLAAFVGISLVLILLPVKLSEFCQKLFFGISLGFYIQGNYININYGSGVLDGTKIDWSKYTTYGLIDTAVWIIAIILPFALSWILDRIAAKNDGNEGKADGKRFDALKVIAIAAVFFTVIQLPALTVQAMSYKPNENTGFTILKKGEFDLAHKDNIIMFILDTMDEEYYNEFLNGHKDYTGGLKGFVHYDNALGSGAKTPVAVPSMFTGHPFKQQETYSRYKTRVWGGDNALSELNDAGYDVSFYSEGVLFSDECTDYLSNFDNNGTKIGSQYIFLKKVYKLDLYKFLPHYLKKYVWFDTAEFDSAIDTSEDAAFILQDAFFMKDYRNSGFTIHEDQEKVARIYHMKAAHQPYKLLDDGKWSDDGATLQSQVTAIMYFVKDMMDDMKEKGVYDDATIIIAADHGDIKRCQHPMLLIKPSGATGDYATDHAPVSFFDLPAYLAGLGGKTVSGQEYAEDLLSLKEGDKRTRYFFRHKGNSSSTLIQEYRTDGDASDEDALKLIREYDSKNIKAEPYVLGTKLKFGIEATGNQYAVEGFGTNTGMRTILRGPYVKMVIPIEDPPETGELSVYIRTNLPQKEHQADHPFIVKVNGEQFYEGITNQKLSDTGIKFKMPASLIGKDKKFTFELTFTDVPMEEMEKDISERTENIRFISMVIDKE